MTRRRCCGEPFAEGSHDRPFSLLPDRRQRGRRCRYRRHHLGREPRPLTLIFLLLALSVALRLVPVFWRKINTALSSPSTGPERIDEAHTLASSAKESDDRFSLEATTN